VDEWSLNPANNTVGACKDFSRLGSVVSGPATNVSDVVPHSYPCASSLVKKQALARLYDITKAACNDDVPMVVN
jgi:hypothetical protein